MISKELLSKVLDCEISYIIDILDVFSRIEYGIIENDLVECKKINQYEFMYKCKEWAFKQKIHFEIESRIIANDIGGYNALPLGYACVLFDNMPYFETKEETETKAVIKACEWILNNFKSPNLS